VRPRRRRGGVAVILALMAGSVVTTGCGSARYVSETTQIAAGHVDSLRGDYERYLQRLDENAASRISLLADERQRLARGQRSLEAQVVRGQYGTLYDDLVNEAGESIETDRAVAERAVVERAALLAKQKPLDRESVKKMQELSKQLLELARPAHLKDSVKFLVEYFQAVGKAVSELNARAKESSEKAKAKSGD
jgi:hypothetical protein